VWDAKGFSILASEGIQKTLLKGEIHDITDKKYAESNRMASQFAAELLQNV
jgi:hypothetical protein